LCLSFRLGEQISPRGKTRSYFEKRINTFFSEIREAIDHRYPLEDAEECEECSKLAHKCPKAYIKYRSRSDPAQVFKEFTRELMHGIKHCNRVGLVEEDENFQYDLEIYEKEKEKFLKEKEKTYMNKKKNAAIQKTKDKLFEKVYGKDSDVEINIDDDINDEEYLIRKKRKKKVKSEDGPIHQASAPKDPNSPGTKDEPIQLSDSESEASLPRPPPRRSPRFNTNHDEESVTSDEGYFERKRKAKK